MQRWYVIANQGSAGGNVVRRFDADWACWGYEPTCDVYSSDGRHNSRRGHAQDAHSFKLDISNDVDVDDDDRY